jgi:hypothetical protein
VVDVSFLVGDDESPGGGLTRAMRGQSDKLMDECETAKKHPAAFAHKARVRAKKIRAALRLARPIMGAKAWREENRWWRDAARKLSDLRDAGARLEALDSLRPFLIARIGSAMTRKLTERFEKEQRAADASKAIDAFRRRLDKRGSKVIPRVSPGSRKRLAEALADGYRSSRKAMKAALETGQPELLHEWRKHAKYHALQARLVRQMFPAALENRHIAARDLAELLGAVQDIEVVFEGIGDWQEGPEGLADALQARRSELIEEARAAGEALFGTRTKIWAKLLARRKGRKKAAPKRKAAPRKKPEPTASRARPAPARRARRPPARAPTPALTPREQPAPPNGVGHEIEVTVGNA